MTGGDWCQWEGCNVQRRDNFRGFKAHTETEHYRCSVCDRHVVSLTGHAAQMRRRGLGHELESHTQGVSSR